MKLTKFSDIPQFTTDGYYQVEYNLVRFVKYLQEEVEEYGLQLNPDFQRGHVWTEQQQIDWLEYFLMGGKSGNVIYLNNPFLHRYREPKPNEYGDYVCVDGLQRITSIQKFVSNEIKVFGSYFKEYEEPVRMIKHNIKVNINDLRTKSEVLKWYIGMNSGGTPHSKSEIERIEELLDKENSLGK
jgi:uncharacterized protein with ParB-like and HNH nuclease domain